jgi:hypothetical protein
VTTKAEREAARKAAEEEVETEGAEEQEAAEEEAAEEQAPPTGPTQTPVEEHDGDEAAKPQEPETVPPAAPEETEGAEAAPTVDDGVEDVELGPPVVGQWVQITAGDYAGRFAAYLGNVQYEEADPQNPYAPPVPAMIQVRTRDADNLVLDVDYADVSSTMYSGGR